MLELLTYFKTICLTILIYYILKYFWNRRYLYYYSSKMNGPFNWPLIGYGWKFLGTDLDFFKKFENFNKTYKAPAAVWLGPSLYFVIKDPKHYEIILNKVVQKNGSYNFLSDAIGTGLLTAPANKWKRHRKLIQPIFNQKILNSFVEIFSEEAKVLVSDLNKFVGKGFFDICPKFNTLNMTIVCKTIMGNDLLTKEQILDFQNRINPTTELVYKRIFKVWYHPKIIWNLTPLSKKLNEYCADFNKYFKDITIQKRKEYQQNSSKDFDNQKVQGKPKWKGFLDYLMEISEKTGQLTNDEIGEELALLIVAGTDTTATTSSFLLLMLGLYPDIQDKVFAELVSIFGESNRQVDLDDLNQMIYLERVIKETLRICPTVPVIGRELTEDIKLESHLLPKGSSCFIAICETHRDPKIWKDPLKFDPDRFLPEEVAKRHPYSFIPFGAGPRNCIGFKYAMMSMKIMLSTILRTYKVSTNYKEFSDLKFSRIVILKCDDGFNVALECRN